MKREHYAGIEQANKHIKPNPTEEKSNTSPELYRDIVHEILSWLPYKFVLLNCTPVSREWQRVIMERLRICLELNSAEWIKLRLYQKDIARNILSLSISSLFQGKRSRSTYHRRRLGVGQLDKMENLKCLSLTGFEIDSEFVQYLIDSTNVDRLVVNDCALPLDALSSFSCEESRLTLVIDPSPNRKTVKVGESEETTRFASVVMQLPRLECIQVQGGKWDEETKKNYYQHLSNRDNLYSIGILLDRISAEYLPRMKSLTSLYIRSSEVKASQLPDMKPLAQLKHITICLLYTSPSPRD